MIEYKKYAAQQTKADFVTEQIPKLCAGRNANKLAHFITIIRKPYLMVYNHDIRVMGPLINTIKDQNGSMRELI